MACGVLAVTKQKQHLVIISRSVLNKDGLVNPESHPYKEKLRWCLKGWSKSLPAGDLLSPALALR